MVGLVTSEVVWVSAVVCWDVVSVAGVVLCPRVHPPSDIFAQVSAAGSYSNPSLQNNCKGTPPAHMMKELQRSGCGRVPTKPGGQIGGASVAADASVDVAASEVREVVSSVVGCAVVVSASVAGTEAVGEFEASVSEVVLVAAFVVVSTIGPNVQPPGAILTHVSTWVEYS